MMKLFQLYGKGNFLIPYVINFVYAGKINVVYCVSNFFVTRKKQDDASAYYYFGVRSHSVLPMFFSI